MPVCAHLPCHTCVPCCDFTLGLVPTRANFTAFASGIWVGLGGMKVSWPGVEAGRGVSCVGGLVILLGECVPACVRDIAQPHLLYTQHKRGTG